MRRRETALEGLTMTERDVLAEASNTNPREPEPALSHIRQARVRLNGALLARPSICPACEVMCLEY